MRNGRVQFKFDVRRNITILRGNSATGKTTLIGMIADYERNGRESGIELSCDKPCVVLSGRHWQRELSFISDSIVFVDEGNAFTLSPDPMTETLQPALASISLGDKGDFTEVLRPLLSNSKIFGLDVSATPLFRTVVDDFASLVSGKGAVRATIHRIVNG